MKPTLVVPAADDVVMLCQLSTFQQAEELRQLLENTGVRAEATGTQNVGAWGGAGAGGSHGLLVRGEDLEQAQYILAAYEDELRGRSGLPLLHRPQLDE